MKPGDINPLGARGLLLAAVPAAAVALAVLLPFVEKAFTVDDVVFLLQATHLLRDPIHPTAFDMVFHGDRIHMSGYHVTGPVMGYLLVPTVLMGGSERAAHLMQIGFVLTTVLATVSLARRLGLRGGQLALAGLLVVFSPAVLAMSATAMPDVAAMAICTLGIERLSAWKEDRIGWHGWVGGFLLALGALTRPHLILLLPCAALWLLEPGESRHRHAIRRIAGAAPSVGPIALALVLLAIANYATRDPKSGTDMTRAIVSISSTQSLWSNLSSFLLQWSMTFPLTILWATVRGGRFLRSRFAWAGFAVGLAIAAMGDYLPLAPFVAMSAAVLGDILGDALTRADRTQLFLGSWLLLAVFTAPYAHLPAKYLVPSAPAVALLIARLDPMRLRRYRPMLATTGALGLALGILIIRADAALAEIGREGGNVVAEYAGREAKVWVDGAWGFQWYGIQGGAEPLAMTEPLPRVGDLVVAGTQNRVLRRNYPHKTLLHRRVFGDPGGRVLSEGAGFFSNGFGPLPWVWGTEELGRIEVWRLDSVPTDPE